MAGGGGPEGLEEGLGAGLGDGLGLPAGGVGLGGEARPGGGDALRGLGGEGGGGLRHDARRHGEARRHGAEAAAEGREAHETRILEMLGIAVHSCFLPSCHGGLYLQLLC